MKTKINFILLCLMLGFSSGCSLWGTVTKKEKISITSDPEGAEVFSASGVSLGLTPLELKIEDYEKHVKDGFIFFKVSKPGYEDSQVIASVDGIQTYKVKLKAFTSQDFESLVINSYSKETNDLARKLLVIQGLLMVKKYTRAKQELNDFVKQYPNIAVAYTLLANVLIKEGDYHQARAILARGLNLDRNDSTAHRLLKLLKEKEN